MNPKKGDTIRRTDESHFDTLGDTQWEARHFGHILPEFMKGLELCEVFFREQVEPIVRGFAPEMPIAAGRLDYGSDVLGYDTELSRDHAWGPQVTLYLTEADLSTYKEALDAELQEKLPTQCCGYPTRMSRDWVWHPTPDGSGHHRVRIESVESFFEAEIGLVPGPQMSVAEWLSIPAQKLRVFAAGRIFVDDQLALTSARESLLWYPHDLWLHIMACQWQKLLERAPFAGRCAHVGDMWGAADNSTETMRNLVYTAHLLEKRYPPYTKWLGTSLKELSIGQELLDLADKQQAAVSWPEREDALVAAYQVVADLHNRTKGLPSVDNQPTTFHSRPYRMIDIESIVRALRGAISDPLVKPLSLAECAVWQMVNYDTALCNRELFKAYRAMIASGALR